MRANGSLTRKAFSGNVIGFPTALGPHGEQTEGRLMFGRELDIARAYGRREPLVRRTAGPDPGYGVVDALGNRRLGMAEPSALVGPRRQARAQAWLYELDDQIIGWAGRAYPWATRIALFVVYFWFGFVKLIGLSEATGLARALTAQTVGLAHFQVMFIGLALFECVLGVLCLIPRATRAVLALLVVHMAMVCAPLLLVRNMTWQTTLVPTMDGQYIIKNVLIIAAAFGLAGRYAPPPTTAVAPSRGEIEFTIETVPVPDVAPPADSSNVRHHLRGQLRHRSRSNSGRSKV